MRRIEHIVLGILIVLGIAAVVIIGNSLLAEIRSRSARIAHPLHQKEGYYLERKTKKRVSFPVPLQIAKVSLSSSHDSSTRILLHLSQLDAGVTSQLKNAVYTIEIHTQDIVVIYTHNFKRTGFLKVRGVAGDDKVSVVRRRGAIPVAEGSLQFENGQKKLMVVQVPIHLSDRDIKAVYFRYFPSVEAARESQTRPPVVSGIFFQRGLFDTRMPGWP